MVFEKQLTTPLPLRSHHWEVRRALPPPRLASSFEKSSFKAWNWVEGDYFMRDRKASRLFNV